MFGLSGAIIIVLALGTALALLLLIVFGAFRGVVRTVRRSFWCPVRGSNVTAEFQEEAWDGEPLEVSSCTAFTPPTAITCEKLCLDRDKFRVAKTSVRATGPSDPGRARLP